VGRAAEHARELVAWADSKAAAARYAGVPRTTFVYWLDPEPAKARYRRGRAEGRDWNQQSQNREHKRKADRERARTRYYQRKDAGLCTKCGEPSLSEAYCWGCLSKKEDARI